MILDNKNDNYEGVLKQLQLTIDEFRNREEIGKVKEKLRQIFCIDDDCSMEITKFEIHNRNSIIYFKTSNLLDQVDLEEKMDELVSTRIDDFFVAGGRFLPSKFSFRK